MTEAALVEVLGWAATAVFVASYFFAKPHLLRRAQMVGALMWVGYGLHLRAAPVVAANVLVLAAAAWTARRAADGASGPVRFEPGAHQTGSVPRRAARFLGLTRTQLRSRLEKYGLSEG